MNQGENTNMNNSFDKSKMVDFPFDLFGNKLKIGSDENNENTLSFSDKLSPKSLKVKQRLEALIEILGKNWQIIGDEYVWACPYCRNEGADSDGDHFKFNVKKNKYKCFASEDHTALISEQLNKIIKNKKEKGREHRNEQESMTIEAIPESESQTVDTSQFKPLTNQELLETLGLTIKKDEANKLITFYCELSAYTGDAQLNISYSAPSSTGKSYNPTEIAQLFPEEDVQEIGYCSPTAFFHDTGNYNKETNTITIDFSGKIVIFLDQPHTQLLQHLRPLLSHDKKEIRVKITDKSQKGGHRTKNVLLKGYPSVVFCTTGLNIDEQESTRFVLLSPETSQEKIRAGICEKIKKDSNKKAYKYFLEENLKRKELKERIRAIQQEKIEDIRISNPEKLEQLFFEKFGKDGTLKPRHQRDIGKIASLIKAKALINLWFRERDDSTIIANEEDIEEGFNLWCEIAESQELNIPPYVYKIYQEVILTAFEEKNENGLERKEVLKKHFEIYGRPLQDKSFRLEIIPMLENAGLIYQEEDKGDKRKKLIYPTMQSTISQPENNSVSSGGVKSSEQNNSATGGGEESNVKGRENEKLKEIVCKESTALEIKECRELGRVFLVQEEIGVTIEKKESPYVIRPGEGHNSELEQQKAIRPTSKKDRLINIAKEFCLGEIQDCKQLKEIDLVEVMRIVHPEVGDSYTLEGLGILVVEGKTFLTKDSYGKNVYNAPKKKDAWKEKYVDE